MNERTNKWMNGIISKKKKKMTIKNVVTIAA